MIALYLMVKFFRAIFWCFAAMIWLCFAMVGLLFVAFFALACIPLHRGGEIWRDGTRSLAPPAYLHGQHGRRRFV